MTCMHSDVSEWHRMVDGSWLITRHCEDCDAELGPVPQNDPPRRMDYKQAAAHLGIKVGTLRAMVCQRVVPHIRLGPRLVVFDSDALDAWLAERVVQPRKAS